MVLVNAHHNRDHVDTDPIAGDLADGEDPPVSAATSKRTVNIVIEIYLIVVLHGGIIC